MKAITAFLSPTCLEEGRPRVHNLRGEANIKLWINQGYLMNFEGFRFFSHIRGSGLENHSMAVLIDEYLDMRFESVMD